jgi:hypothetical protein
MKHNQNLTAREIARHICEDLGVFDLVPAAGEATVRARELAARLIGPEIVSVEALRQVQDRSGAALFVTYEGDELTGVLAFVLLNRAGLEAVLSGQFEARSPAPEHVARPDEFVSAFYGWGVAATTKPSAQRVVEAARAMGRSSVAHVPYFARPTTEAGHRLMRERMNFVDLPGSDGLVWAPPSNERAAAA